MSFVGNTSSVSYRMKNTNQHRFDFMPCADVICEMLSLAERTDALNPGMSDQPGISHVGGRDRAKADIFKQAIARVWYYPENKLNNTITLSYGLNNIVSIRIRLKRGCPVS